MGGERALLKLQLELAVKFALEGGEEEGNDVKNA